MLCVGICLFDDGAGADCVLFEGKDYQGVESLCAWQLKSTSTCLVDVYENERSEHALILMLYLTVIYEIFKEFL